MIFTEIEKEFYKIWFRLKHHNEYERIKIFRELTLLNLKEAHKYDKMFFDHYNEMVRGNTLANKQGMNRTRNIK